MFGPIKISIDRRLPLDPPSLFRPDILSIRINITFFRHEWHLTTIRPLKKSDRNWHWEKVIVP